MYKRDICTNWLLMQLPNFIFPYFLRSGMWNGSNPEDMYIGDMQYGDFNGLGDAPMDFDGAMIE